jgi:phosphoribosylformylglycinamidine synthase subunit PurL
MGDACRRFNTPVTGGNVSFYNQHPAGAVYPTPTIGMVGLLEHVSNKMTLNFKEEGDIIYLVGQSSNDINSSEYLHKIIGVEFSPAPQFDLEEELAVQQTISSLISKKLIRSAHDISEGGLFITLAESGFTSGLGFSISSEESFRKDAWLFGEAQSRIVVTVIPEQVTEFEAALAGKSFHRLGTVTSGSLQIDGENWGTIEDWKNKYDKAIENLLAGQEIESALVPL